MILVHHVSQNVGIRYHWIKLTFNLGLLPLTQLFFCWEKVLKKLIKSKHETKKV